MLRFPSCRLMIVAVLLALPTSTAFAATVAEELEEDSSLTSDFITPHKEWARPYAKGPVKALFVIGAGADVGAYMEPSTRIREATELMQRFDIKGDAVIVSGGQFYQLKLGETRARRLLEENYDVYIFANADFSNFSPELQYKILERVIAGAGLVCVGPRPAEVMAPKRCVSPLPPDLYQAIPLAEMQRRIGLISQTEKISDTEAANRILSAYRIGKGRGVSLSYSAWALTPYMQFSFRAKVEYDYWMMLAGRAVQWAALKEGDTALNCAIGDNATLPQSMLPNGSLKVTIASRIPAKAQLHMTVCRSDGWAASLPQVNLSINSSEPAVMPLSLPRLRVDRYYLDCILRGPKGVLAYGAGAFEVTCPEGIDSVKMDSSFVERGESISGRVTARGSLGASDTIRVQLRDGYDRVLALQDLSASPGRLEYPFTFAIGEWATITMRAEALLVRGGNEIEMKDTRFLVPKRRRGQFNFVQWDTPRDVLGYYAWQKMREAGWEINLGGTDTASQAADVSIIPYSTRLLDQKDENGIMQPCCWNDESKVNDYVKSIVKPQEISLQTGAFVYSLGDEGTTSGCCVHPACIAAYRKYLQEQYGTIEALNASWGTTFASFDSVDLLDHKNNMETGALELKQYPRWYDRQAFSRYNLAKFSGRFVKAYKDLDPQAITGFEGTGGFGDDFDVILGTNTFWSPYPGIGDDIIRSVAPRELIRANWMGYTKDADSLITMAWRMVVKSMDSIWWWRWDGAGTWRGYVRPTLDFWPATRVMTEDLRPVREGLGDLLLRSTPVHSGIAIFYSLPSALSHALENSREFVSPETDHTEWLKTMYDLGLDFRYITSKMLKSGILDSREFKLLLLPMTQAIGPEEANALRRFVEAGGTVIADVRPGIYNDHCKPITPGVLDALFGIRRTERGGSRRSPVLFDLSADATTPLGGQKLSLHLDDTNIDPCVAIDGTSQALARAGDTPLLIVNAVGKGRAVLLNFELRSSKGDHDAVKLNINTFVHSLFRSAGVQPAIGFSSPDSKPLNLTEAHIWKSDDATLFALWHDLSAEAKGNSPATVRVSLPEARYTYDLRHKKALGRIREFTTTVKASRANFFAALPYEIRGLRIGVSPGAPQRGESVEVTMTLSYPPGAKTENAAWVEVVDPKGRPLPGSQRVVIMTNGLGKTTYRVAFNDIPGRWRVRATELFSRLNSQAEWELK